MPEGLLALLAATASIALLHTVAGPDHYVPFVAMAKAGDWSRTKTVFVTLLCGLGHVISSVFVASLGVGLALQLESLLRFESWRGDWAAWALIAFGLIYTVWAWRCAQRGRPHTHVHVHQDGTLHRHEHRHNVEHLHVHQEPKPKFTPWVLFVVFLLGPCEPLIPLLMAEKATYGWGGFAAIVTVFATVTLTAMAVMVEIGLRGVAWLRMPRLERYAHVVAGLAVLACGLGVRFLGF